MIMLVTLVTNNATAMEKAKKIVVEKYSHISVYSCISHTLNLFIGDIIKINSLNSIELSYKKTVKKINNSHLNLSKFNKLKLKKKMVKLYHLSYL